MNGGGSSGGELGTDRLLAFSDGVFAIAITLLVLNLATPKVQHGLWDALVKQWPAYLSYVLSFIIIGIIWAQHHHMFRHITRSDHIFLLINVVFLMWVASIPFPTSLLAQYLQNASERQTAMSIYAGSFVVGAILFNLVWRYATYGGRLMDDRIDRQSAHRITRSYNVGPFAYLIDFALSFVSAQASLILFILLAVFYALSPLPGGDRFMASLPTGGRTPE